jgi:eukaryotic-like serine/threonine-protein kinase
MLPLNHVLQNRYRIIRPLGKGGMGHVYEAMDDAVDCIVAIKETFAATDKLRRAFEREAKLLANLRHPVLPRVTHHFLEGEGQFLVMDYIEGMNLQELLALRKHPFRAEELLPEADKLLSALHYLHSRSEPIIHRDIKPANIKRTSEGEIYLLDFGLAKGSAGQMATVEPGESFYSSVYGYTAAYAPLEQLTNAGTNAQSDLYGLGATLYHLFTGHAPLSANVRYEALEMGAADPLPTIHQVNPQIPEQVSEVISQAMQMSRRDRTRTASEMREALREASRASEKLADTQLPSTLVPQVESTSPAPADIGSAAEFSSPDSARSEPTIKAAPRVVAPQSAPRPSATVSPPEQSGPRLGAMSEQPPGATVAAKTDLAQPRISLPQDQVAARTMVVNQPPAVESAWNSLSTSSSFLPAEKPRSNTARIVIICAVIAVFFGAILWLYLSSKSETANTANATNAPIAQTAKPSLALPATYRFQRDLQSGQGVVWSVAVSPDGASVWTAGDNQRVVFYDGRSFNPSGKAWFIGSVVNSIAFSPDSEVIASASNDRLVKIQDETTATTYSPLIGHTDEVYFVAFSPDGKTLASASKDKTARVWDVQSHKEIKTLSGHRDIVWSVTFSPDGKSLASASKDKTVKIWNTQTWDLLRTLTVHNSAVIAVAFSPDGKLLATGSDDNTIKLWDTNTWQELRTLTGHASYITSLAFSGDGQVLASASNDMTVRLWNPQTGEARQTLTGHTKGVTSVSFSPDGRTIITGSRDQTVKVWQ